MSILIGCPVGRILNPETDKYVDINSITGRKIIKELTTIIYEIT